jgi:hypothetical protein
MSEYYPSILLAGMRKPKTILSVRIVCVPARSYHVRFVEDKVVVSHVSSEYLGFPCQFSFHRLLHIGLPSGADPIGQLVADVTSGLSLTPPQGIKRSMSRLQFEHTFFPVRNRDVIAWASVSSDEVLIFRTRRGVTWLSNCWRLRKDSTLCIDLEYTPAGVWSDSSQVATLVTK